MLRFFTNRELSRNLQIPLAKWKRWSREFLPPDPLGGLQSGVARRYSVDQALIVFIGGHLVAALKTSIPEARTILADLNDCFHDIGVFAKTRIDRRYRLGDYGQISAFTIFFASDPETKNPERPFIYTIRGLASRTAFDVGHRVVHREEYLEICIATSTQPPLDIYRSNVRLLPISAVVDQFTSAMTLDRRYFPILDYFSARSS